MVTLQAASARGPGRRSRILLVALVVGSIVPAGIVSVGVGSGSPGRESAAEEPGLAGADEAQPCHPLTCKRLGFECGEWDDGCGGALDCGTCADGSACVDGQCVTEGDWSVASCSRVTGTEAVSFTTDEGLTLAGTRPLRETSYSHGLAVLDQPNALLATQMTAEGNRILRSENGGCNWSEIEALDDWNLLLLTAAPGGGAYAWSRGREGFYRVQGDEVGARTAPSEVYGLSVDPLDAEHLRIGGYDCQLYESSDGGASFVPVGSPANTGNGIFFAVEFHPADWNQALCGTLGAWRTTDGGQSWNPVAPFDKADPDWVYLFEYAPSDPQRVWARANLESLDRQILVSEDGGASFVTAVAQGASAADQNGVVRTVTLTNQPTMAARAEDPAVLYFVFGSYFSNYGTDLFRYDLLSGELRVVHIDGLDGIDAIAFSPADPAVMYLGLEEEQVH